MPNCAGISRRVMCVGRVRDFVYEFCVGVEFVGLSDYL